MITDDMMRERLARTKKYSLLILHPTEKLQAPGAYAVVWEHGRRNFQLRQDGVLNIVCPVGDGSDVCGIGIFDASLDEVRRLMEGDPGVQAGLFTYEVHETRGFPGDALR
ncbi:MAG TPA: YciI family protein [Gemmatimonadaceae bacterium]